LGSAVVSDSQFTGPAAEGVTGVGSSITINESLFQDSLGIGIRGMRKSYISARNSYFSTIRVSGVAEDGSTLVLNECGINGSIIGLAAYKNNPGYTPAVIIADNFVDITNTATPYLFETGSIIDLDGLDIPAPRTELYPMIKEITGISA